MNRINWIKLHQDPFHRTTLNFLSKNNNFKPISRFYWHYMIVYIVKIFEKTNSVQYNQSEQTFSPLSFPFLVFTVCPSSTLIINKEHKVVTAYHKENNFLLPFHAKLFFLKTTSICEKWLQKQEYNILDQIRIKLGISFSD